MRYTAEEVEAALTQGIEDFYWDELDWELNRKADASGGVYIRGRFVPVTVVESETGHEGDWDIGVYVIISAGDQYFRKTGRYQSHVGTDWDRGPLREVHPVEKTVMVFEDK